MPPCSVSMRRRPFRRWIASIRCCRLRRVAPSATDSNTTGTEPLVAIYGALDTATGRVHGKTTARHTSRDFVVFLKEVVALCPPDQQIHILLDNLSAHKTALLREFLEQHPRVRFHFTPTYSSWLNQVELWFAKIEQEVIARGVFTSVPDLARKLRRYINAFSANAQPIYWKYSDPSHRIRCNKLSATGHK